MARWWAAGAVAARPAVRRGSRARGGWRPPSSLPRRPEQAGGARRRRRAPEGRQRPCRRGRRLGAVGTKRRRPQADPRPRRPPRQRARASHAPKQGGEHRAPPPPPNPGPIPPSPSYLRSLRHRQIPQQRLQAAPQVALINVGGRQVGVWLWVEGDGGRSRGGGHGRGWKAAGARAAARRPPMGVASSLHGPGDRRCPPTPLNRRTAQPNLARHARGRPSASPLFLTV